MVFDENVEGGGIRHFTFVATDPNVKKKDGLKTNIEPDGKEKSVLIQKRNTVTCVNFIKVDVLVATSDTLD